MSTTTIKQGMFNIDWASDTTREQSPCVGGCGKTTTGMSKGKPWCLPCALQKATGGR